MHLLSMDLLSITFIFLKTIQAFKFKLKIAKVFKLVLKQLKLFSRVGNNAAYSLGEQRCGNIRRTIVKLTLLLQCESGTRGEKKCK